jgi:hypothetical protein
MNTALIFMVVGVSAVAGGLLGFLVGFCFASHADVLRGVRPSTSNFLVRFLARPTSEFTFLEGVMLLVLMIVWLAVCVLLCAVPVIATLRFTADLESSPLFAYAVFVASGWFGRRFGAHAWWAMS